MKHIISDKSTDGVTVPLVIRCPLGGGDHGLNVDFHLYHAWLRGEIVAMQVVNGDVDLAELLISGTCPDCWNELFAGDDDEE